MTINGQNIQWPSGTPYVAADRGTMALGAKEVVQPIPDVIVASQNFETDPITGSGTWFLDTTNPHTGIRYLRSAVIGNNASTIYTFPVPPTATSLRFWYRISSELNFDFLKVYKNSVLPGNVLFSTSGTANVWIQLSVPLAGVTSVIFEYSKDGSSIGGLDLAAIDDLEWIIPGVAGVTNYEPLHLDVNNCLKVSLCSNHIIIDSLPEVEIKNDVGNPVPVSVTNTVPVTVTNTVTVQATDLDIRNLDCLTDSVTICPGINPIPVLLDEPIDVNVLNFPAVAHLNCATDSVAICPGADPIVVTVNNFPAVAHLDCLTDSVTICPGVNPITVTGTVTVSNTITVDVGFDYAEDSPHVSGDVGAFILAVRNDDPLNTVTTNNGDYSPVSVTSTGRVYTTDRGNFAEDTAHTSGHFGEFILAVRNDNPLNQLTDTDGDYSPIAVTSTGRVQTTDRANFAEDTPASSGHFGEFILGVRNDTGAVRTDTDGDYSPFSTDSVGRIGITDLGGSITIDGTVAISNQITQYVEDTPGVSGDVGLLMLAQRWDPGTGSVTTDGDYSTLHLNAFGQLKVDVGGQTINTSQVGFTTANISSVAGSATSVQLLASNTNRRRVYLTNESLSVAYIAFGAAASATAYTIVMQPSQSMIIDYPCYSGVMNVIWTTAVGSMRITEVAA